MHRVGFVAWVSLLLLALGWAGSARAGIDPQTVGTWVTMMPNAQGVAQWVWEIRADGRYSFQASGPGAPPGHSGTISTAGGSWQLQADGGSWEDGGSYQTSGDMLVATGRLGTAAWQRSGSPGAPQLATAAGVWPASLPEKLAKARGLARGWRADAVAIEAQLQLKPPTLAPSAPDDAYETSFTFYSPAGQERLSITPGNQAGELWPGGFYDHSDRVPIPDEFLGFERAVAIAQALGMRGRAERADLGTWHNACGSKAVGWTIWPVSATTTYQVPAAVVQAGSAEQAAEAMRANLPDMEIAAAALLPERYRAVERYVARELDERDRAAGVIQILQVRFPNSGTDDSITYVIYRDHVAAAADTAPAGLSMPHRVRPGNGFPELRSQCAIGGGTDLLKTECSQLGAALPVTVFAATFDPPRIGVTIDSEAMWNSRTGPLLAAGVLLRRAVCGE